MTTPGERFVRALAAKDFERLAGLLDPAIDFRGMTPNGFWQASGPAEVVDQVLRRWFEDQDVIEAVVALDTGRVADRDRVAWRFAVATPDGPHLVEQQAYYETSGGRISWMRVLCSGFRPAPPG
jgi:hypothetical protein